MNLSDNINMRLKAIVFFLFLGLDGFEFNGKFLQTTMSRLNCDAKIYNAICKIRSKFSAITFENKECMFLNWLNNPTLKSKV